MLLRTLFLVLALFAGVTAASAEVTMEFLTNPNGALASWDLTPDGTLAAANFGGQIFLLDPAGNYSFIATLPGGAGGVGISADGTVIVANQADAQGREEPVILRESEGWVPQVLPVPDGYQPCDFFKAASYGVSADGTKVTGILWDTCTAKAFLWTEETGMQDLGPTRASAISDDGSVIVGFNRPQRRPAYWTVEGNIGSSSILLHHEEDQGEVFEVSTDGQVMVGTGLPYGYDPIYTGYQAFRYEIGDPNLTLLGTLTGSPNDISKALMIADNGVIMGVSGPTSVIVSTFIWTPTLGMTDLKEYLIDNGVPVDITVRLNWPKAFSNDGSTLIGEYYTTTGDWGYYRVKFSSASAVQDMVRHSARLTDISPNPFNPMTKVSFSLESRQNVQVSVFDLSGRKVAILADGQYSAGDHQLEWRGKDLSGREVSSGSYIVRLESGQDTASRTISLVR